MGKYNDFKVLGKFETNTKVFSKIKGKDLYIF